MMKDTSLPCCSICMLLLLCCRCLLLLLAEIICIVVLVIQCCCCSAYTVLADTCDTNAAALLLNRSHPGNTTSQSLLVLLTGSTRHCCLRSQEGDQPLQRLQHAKLPCAPSCNKCGRLNDANLPRNQQKSMSLMPCRHASTLKVQKHSIQASHTRPWANRMPCYWQSALIEVEFELACHDIGIKTDMPQSWQSDLWESMFESENETKMEIELHAHRTL